MENLEKSGQEEDGFLCSICFSIPESKEKYVFELCGHPICKECLTDQIISGDFPLKCSKEHCGTEICVPDIDAGIKFNEEAKRTFFERSFKDFLDKSSQFANCPVPDCTGIVPKDPEEIEGIMFHCHDCGSDICVR